MVIIAKKLSYHISCYFDYHDDTEITIVVVLSSLNFKVGLEFIAFETIGQES
jgi:hypothetical protein